MRWATTRLPSTSMRSRPGSTRSEPLRTILPATRTRPSATRISACLREHRPSFDSARQRLTPDGFAPALGEGRGRPVFGRGVIVLRDRSGKSGLSRQPISSPGERFQAVTESRLCGYLYSRTDV
ncbi:hypothetical protein BQ8794_70094 [Mesorhizobium prunaredense]|uniref:Uncharacterized protein n=1 Tax=Mesorhizobium prunaredense TaxID=1631249 RepID=A0A1R3VH14_9HYPH|nr:hypothetical protein BQ8794_70094 [Mesorhizobium prunaredense]